ncbi:alpha-amylase family glycosyl hydrolase [Cribrihabitans pelagius]|uniref:alpha-amylase family glycosyl hydrolase n=1 Tax=Cribrihabitans pelagius TaxID=1765746 RepID=UPI003B5AC9A2
MAQAQDWWRGAVIYQIYPRSFMDGNGDGIGDIPGITDRLDQIAELGVDAIWLSPIFTSPMADMGYDVENYTDIDPVFGTLADFDAMVAKAHALGLKVMIDQVISHSSDRHPFFQQSKQCRGNGKADWFVWADPKPDGSAPNNWQGVFGGIAWEWEARRGQYYLHNFLKEQPDWNFHNPEVQEYLLGTMRFWLERGVDGFRLDTANFYFHDKLLRDDAASPRPEDQNEPVPYRRQYHLFSKNQPENLAFLQKMRALLDEFEGRTLVGEIGESHHPIEIMGQYTSGNRLHMAYSFEMLDKKFTARHFRQQIEGFFGGAPEGWPCWAFSNHDVIRHVTRWREHGADQDALAKLSAAMLLSLEGSICLYQGEELGQTETELDYSELTDPQGLRFWPQDKGRDGCRTPMVWDAEAPHGGFSTAGSTWLPVKEPQLIRASNGQDVRAFYKKMLALRRSEPALREGKTEFLDTPEPLLAFRRGENLLCVFNLSPADAELDLPSRVEALLSDRAAVNGTRLQLQGNGVLIGNLAG